MSHDSLPAWIRAMEARSRFRTELEASPAWADKWIGMALSAGPTDRPAFEAAVESCYRAAGEPWHGKVVWVSSPVGNFRLSTDRGTPARGDPRYEKLDLFSPAFGQLVPHMVMQEGRSFSLQSMDENIERLVSTVLIDAIEEAAIPEWASPFGREMTLWLLQRKSFLNASHTCCTFHNNRRANIDLVTAIHGRRCAGMASLSFARDVLGMSMPGQAGECLAAFEAASAEVLWWYPTSHYVFVCKRPSVIHTERVASTLPFLTRTQHRLHADHGPAVVWPDGWAIYAIHGVQIPFGQRHVVERPDTITTAEIEAERNTEIRRVMIERYGPARYVADSGAIVVHELPADHPCTGLRSARLLRKDVQHDEPMVCADLLNSTPEPDGSVKRYLLRVDPNAYDGEASRNAHAAAASTWRHADGSLVYADWRDYRPFAES